jgi:hypothetical protein
VAGDNIAEDASTILSLQNRFVNAAEGVDADANTRSVWYLSVLYGWKRIRK